MIERVRRTKEFWVAVLCALFVSGAAQASHVTVLPDSTGDYPTLNDAVQATYEFVADTILVEPGFYDETVNFPSPPFVKIVGRAGADSTRIHAFTALPEPENFEGHFGGLAVGLTVDSLVAFGRNSRIVNWQDCAFEGGFYGENDNGGAAPTFRCAFRDSSSFIGFGQDMDDCSFESAPVYVENVIGFFRMKNCSFRGPAMQLAHVRPRDMSEIVFEECTFDSATVGIRVKSLLYVDQAVFAVRCRFQDLAAAAIEHEFGDWTVPAAGHLKLKLANSTVTRVGHAIHCFTPGLVRLSLDADTIATTTSHAVESVVRDGTLSGLRIHGAAGDGLHLVNQTFQISPSVGGANAPKILDARITACDSAGIEIVQLDQPVWDPQNIQIRGSVIDSNGTAGIRFAGAGPIVSGCLLHANGADGLRVIPAGDAPACSLYNNTLVGNAGFGIAVTCTTTVNTLSVHHNLVTSNTLGGITLLAAYAGEASFNDAWLNLGPAYSGLAGTEANLEENPLYCDPDSLDFTVASQSPCAPAPVGPYGSIGAYVVGCETQSAVEPVVLMTASELRIAPNPAHSIVSFLWTGRTRIENLEVFDVQGRRRWRAPGEELRGGALRWDAHDNAGQRLPAGVYLVRWRDARHTATSRMVLLGSR